MGPLIYRGRDSYVILGWMLVTQIVRERTRMELVQNTLILFKIIIFPNISEVISDLYSVCRSYLPVSQYN
jgi:hypothetical protein